MANVLLVLVAMMLLRALLNGYRFVQCRRYLREYRQYLADATVERGWLEVTHQVLKLFKDAGLEDTSRPYLEPVGYLHVVQAELPVFKNLHNTRQDIVDTVVVMFHQATGVYRSRVLETFCPLYWLQLVVNLRRHALAHLVFRPRA